MKIDYSVFDTKTLNDLPYGATFVLEDEQNVLYMVIDSPEDAGIDVKEDEIAVFSLEDGYIESFREDTKVIQVSAKVTLTVC